MLWNEQYQRYESARYNQSTPTILWTPAGEVQLPTHTGHPHPEIDAPIFVHPIDESGKDSITTPFPAPEAKNFNDYILIFPIDSGLPPVYIFISEAYGETNTKGKYSGREYDGSMAGGEIENLDWKDATITQEGIDKVKIHTGRFEPSADNDVMIERLEKIVRGEISVTDTDKRFYTHEIRELERYRNLGISDGTIPDDEVIAGKVWNATHTATLEDYKINTKIEPLYTKEADIARDEQSWREHYGR